MKPIKTAILAVSAAVLSGCAPAQQAAPVPYTGGDACEYAKQVFISALQNYEANKDKGETPVHVIPIIQNFAGIPEEAKARRRLKTARDAMLLACHEEDDDGAWACAEGHSCK